MEQSGTSCSLNEFLHSAADHVEQLRSSGEPLVLTIDGKPALVVQDVFAYERLLDEHERLSAAEGIRRGLEAMKRGDLIPFEEFMEGLRRKYESPDSYEDCECESNRRWAWLAMDFVADWLVTRRHAEPDTQQFGTAVCARCGTEYDRAIDSRQCPFCGWTAPRDT